MSTTLSLAQQRDEQARLRFEADTAEHQLTVLRDDGLYRHLRLQRPGTSVYFYDLVTWPGHLVICGDAGDYHFARIADMFEFFESGHGGINPHYWSEKLQSGAGPGGDIAQRYSPDALRRYLDEWVAELAEWGDVARMRTLNTMQAQKGKEQHLCPLQFDIVERLIVRYSNEGDVVFDPFAGIMTVPYCATKLGRFGIGVELSPIYWRDGIAHLQAAERQHAMPTLFAAIEAEEAVA